MSKPVPHLLRDLVEPIAANVYFAPEAINGYAELDLGYPQGYFASRGACLGQVDGRVIAAAFGVFYPPMVVGFVDEAWSKTDAPTILDVRRKGATASLERILGDKPDGLDRATELLRRAGEAGTIAGHPLYAGLLSLDWPGDPMGNLWRAADIVREHRGDSHTAAWTSAGLTAIEVLLLTEAWWGIEIHTYSRTRAWPDDEVNATIAVAARARPARRQRAHRRRPRHPPRHRGRHRQGRVRHRGRPGRRRRRAGVDHRAVGQGHRRERRLPHRPLNSSASTHWFTSGWRPRHSAGTERGPTRRALTGRAPVQASRVGAVDA